MKLINKAFTFCLIVVLIGLASCDQENKHVAGEPEYIELSDTYTTLRFATNGGALVSVFLNKDSVNPLNWYLTQEQMPNNNQNGAPFAGHFLCTGRWGAPTEGEMKAGVPHNGELTNTPWTLIENTGKYIKMLNDAPLDGFNAFREIEGLISTKNLGVYRVSEHIKNTTSIGRLNNIVQHATLGPPFLNRETIVNTNATYGFNQQFDIPNPHQMEYTWPIGFADSSLKKVNFEVCDNSENYCTTHIFEDSLGWVSAYDPHSENLIIYVFETTAYPFLNVWQWTAEDGTPNAKGIEFGTTGIGEPYPNILVDCNSFHNHKSFFFHDAHEIVSKTYFLILAHVPNYTPIESISQSKGKLEVNMTNSTLNIDLMTN